MSEENTPEAPIETQTENGAAELSEHEQMHALLQALTLENNELKDQRLRALAEAENIRRRGEREKQDASTYAVTKFARDMLTVADNFGRALAACPPEKREAADPQVKAVIEGVEVTERQLLSILENHGIKIIDTSDGKFDPNLHQAVAEVPGEGKPAGSIVHVVQTGFKIGERLLRPAMVTVARKEDAPAATNTQA
ncbi:molecular chaperone GrpE [Rhizomicrobium palustre]|uniref:Protein GrpE n=1 Tax=Rhizomicrobium palustre TaxID=189966 RepID=A0A846MX79_9PROT|nr:nucleotide exchange factor GrpE [Rhizomicrobium palustre]NIK88164.1 molecular chaperone GrpE [Rhizomicrobium palustre]